MIGSLTDKQCFTLINFRSIIVLFRYCFISFHYRSFVVPFCSSSSMLELITCNRSCAFEAVPTALNFGPVWFALVSEAVSSGHLVTLTVALSIHYVSYFLEGIVAPCFLCYFWSLSTLLNIQFQLLQFSLYVYLSDSSHLILSKITARNLSRPLQQRVSPFISVGCNCM